MAFRKRVLATAVGFGFCLSTAIAIESRGAQPAARAAEIAPPKNTAGSSANVTRIPVTINASRYDPRHPTTRLPTTLPDEVGVTVSEFGCSAKVTGSVLDQSQIGQTIHVLVKVDTVQITLRLDINEWIAQNAGEKIASHENGHRIVAEHFYAHAEIPAQAITRSIIGQRFTGEGPDPSTAANQAMDHAATQITQQYMAAVRDPSQQVQEAYDRITAHGTNDIDELNAIDQALNETAKIQAAMGKPPLLQ